MDVFRKNSRIASRIVFRSSSATQKNRLQSVHDNVLHQQTVKVTLCSLGNTRLGQKVSGLSSECLERRHRAVKCRTVKQHFYLGAMKVCVIQFAVMVKCCLANNNALMHLDKLCTRCWPNTSFHRCVSHKTPLTCLHASFLCFLP